jgi:hypothetical protein
MPNGGRPDREIPATTGERHFPNPQLRDSLAIREKLAKQDPRNLREGIQRHNFLPHPLAIGPFEFFE